MEQNPVFSQNFEIQSHHIVRNFEASLQYLMGCMQHTAERHVDSLHIGWDDLHAKGCFWAIYRMGIRIERMPKKYETITVRTWANPPQRLIQPRSFEILDHNGNVILQAQSMWIILEEKTFRPLTIEDVAGCGEAMYRMGDGNGFTMNLKIGSIDTAGLSPACTRTVLYSDIDTNHHVNNTNYVRWFIDSFSSDFLEHHFLRSIVINYTLQALIEEQYSIYTKTITESSTLSVIVRGKDELCKIKAEWQSLE